MLLLILILVGVLSVIALLIILWDFFKHGGAAVLDPEHPGRIITMKEAKARKQKTSHRYSPIIIDRVILYKYDT